MKVLTALALLLLCAAPAAAQQKMWTTWYGRHDGSGKYTADGSVFDFHDPHTVAHKNLPFGTRLRITNPKNGRVLLGIVKDRGPFVKGRQLDLTYAGAQALGIGGLALLTVEILR